MRQPCWPDDLELQVALWDKTLAQIAQELGCSATGVSRHVKMSALLKPDPDYFWRLAHKLPVEIPAEVLEARTALAVRKSGTLNNPGMGPKPSQSPPPRPSEDQN